MKIHFQCPICDHQERIGALAVGWKKLKHRCPSCGNTSSLDYKQLRVGGLLAIGLMACWGVALTGRMAFQLSSDATLIAFLVLLVCLSMALSGRVVDACSSWRRDND